MKYHEIAEQAGVTVGKVKMDASRGKLDKDSPESVAAYLKALRGDKDLPDLFTTENHGALKAEIPAAKPAEKTTEQSAAHAPMADLSVNAGRKKTEQKKIVSAVADKVDRALAIADNVVEPVAPRPELAERTSVPVGDPLVEGSNAWLLSKPVGFVYRGFKAFYVEVRKGADGKKELKDFPRSGNFVPCRELQDKV